MKKETKKRVWANVAGLVFVFLAMAAAAISRDGRLLGRDLTRNETEASSPVTDNPDGSLTVNTGSLATNVTGYAGPVPVEITITDGKIATITPLENNETPGFFNRVIRSGIIDNWIGKTPEEALAADVDAVTGATFSSEDLIANVRSGLSYYLDSPTVAAKKRQGGVEFYCALVVALMASILPLVIKNKNYRTVQQLLNVGVLGFWAGTFLDYTVMLGLMSNGIGAAAATVITLVMLAVGFIYPLFGKKDFYCAWMCPLGSLQELAGKCNPRHKWHLSPRAVKSLQWFRTGLWAVLMFGLWTGMLTEWIDYELFTAFMVNEAATGVLIAGGVFVALSIFITRPYCRFVCPTGALLRISEKIDSK